MRALTAVLLSVFMLTACTPQKLYSNYQQRQTAERLAKGADAVALVTVVDKLPSYEIGREIYTDVEVIVMRGQNVKAGEKLTIRRHGGTVPIPGTNMERSLIVDYIYLFPEKKGSEAFVLLRRVGEKYEIIDAMALQDGQPLMNRPENQVYLPFLNSLE